MSARFRMRSGDSRTRLSTLRLARNDNNLPAHAVSDLTDDKNAGTAPGERLRNISRRSVGTAISKPPEVWRRTPD